ncbi:hypothetical protein ABKN59_005803 [Abortiporus biennis]
MVAKRCFWYTTDEKPIERTDGVTGCVKSTIGRCKFTHPWDAGWDIAPPAPPAPEWLVKKDRKTRNRKASRSKSRERRGRTSPFRRPGSKEGRWGRRNSRSRSRSPYRRDLPPTSPASPSYRRRRSYTRSPSVREVTPLPRDRRSSRSRSPRRLPPTGPRAFRAHAAATAAALGIKLEPTSPKLAPVDPARPPHIPISKSAALRRKAGLTDKISDGIKTAGKTDGPPAKHEAKSTVSQPSPTEEPPSSELQKFFPDSGKPSDPTPPAETPPKAPNANPNPPSVSPPPIPPSLPPPSASSTLVPLSGVDPSLLELVSTISLSCNVNPSTPTNLPLPEMQSKSAPADEEKWSERIKALSSAVAVLDEVSELEKNKRVHNQFMNAPYNHAAFSPEERSNLQTEAVKTSLSHAAAQKKMSETISALAATGTWDLLPSKPDMSAEDEARRNEALQIITNLKSTVTQVHDVLQNMRSLAMQLKLVGSGDGDIPLPPSGDGPQSQSAHEESMHIDNLEDGEVPVTSEEAPVALEIEAFVSRSKPINVLSLEETSQLLQSNEERLDFIIEYCHEQFTDVTDWLNDLLNEKVAEVQTAVMSEADALKAQVASVVDKYKKVEILDKNIDQTGEEISALAVDVAKVVEGSGPLREENAKLKAENAMVKEENAKLKEQLALMEKQQRETLDATRKEMDAVNEALTAYISQKPPAVPTQSIEDIIASIKPQIIAFIHEEFQPMLDDLHETVQVMLKAHNERLDEAFTPKITTTLRYVQTLANWAEKLRGDQDIQLSPSIGSHGPSISRGSY